MLQETQLIQMIHVGWVCVWWHVSVYSVCMRLWQPSQPKHTSCPCIPEFHPLLSSSFIRLREKQEWRRGSNKKRQKGRDCSAFVYTHFIPKSLGNVFMKFSLSSQSMLKFVCLVLTEWKFASGLWVNYEGWWEIRTWEIQCLKANILSTTLV